MEISVGSELGRKYLCQGFIKSNNNSNVVGVEEDMELRLALVPKNYGGGVQ